MTNRCLAINSSSSAKSAYTMPGQVDSRALIFKDFFTICILDMCGGNADLFFNKRNSLNSKAPQ